MKSVNIRQTKKEFIKSYHLMYNNPYFKALQQAMELVNRSIYNRYDNINLTYNDDGLIYLAVSDSEGNETRILSVNKK